jgi:Ca-activated chloride channel family protein
MIDVTFAEPRTLWALMAPALLLALWFARLLRLQIDRRRLRTRRVVPNRERLPRLGDSLFWLCVVLSSSALLIALARPSALATMPQRPGIDVVVLQDASASMRVADLGGIDRWQRSMQFLRELGDALNWGNDRVAVIAFAHVATPQIRLTRDPNTLFFFLDHLHEKPPFRLEDETTWDTNLEEAIAWGLRIVDKDREVHGRTANATAFVMLSDGEAWSGQISRAVRTAASRGIPVFVVGVGTLGGGRLPVVRTATGDILGSPGVSRLERVALQRIAAAGHGEYFELERDGARAIATSIVSTGRRLAPANGVTQVSEELYWWFIVAAALIGGAGLLFVRQPAELMMVLAGGLVAAAVLAPVLW